MFHDVLHCYSDSVADDEMDTILLLTDSHYYVVNYDDELDCLTHYQKISLLDLYAVDIGGFIASSPYGL